MKELRQMALPEERETTINIDNYEKKVRVYTNNVTVMRRMERRGVEFCKESHINGEVFSREYVLDLKDANKVGLHKSLFA